MGLPGSGKTTLANELGPMLNAKRLKKMEEKKRVFMELAEDNHMKLI